MLSDARNDLGTWQSVVPGVGAAWFSALQAPWWIAGGWAIDLFLGKQSRAHKDLDVGVLRRDFEAVRGQLSSWEMFEAKDGTLTRLSSRDLPRPDVHSLWCRPIDTQSWTLELMLDEAVDDLWIYRRQPSVQRPMSTLIRNNPSGLPYLAPEVQLLYKARWLRPRDHRDFEEVAPHLEARARDWLMDALRSSEPGHPWLDALSNERDDRDLPIRRSARLVILDPENRILLFRYQDGHRPPIWSTAGGGLEPGEDYREAAQRELLEETGFDVPIGRMLRTWEGVFAVAVLGTIRSMEQYFLVESKGGPPDRTNWTEVERATIREHRWWSVAEMNATDETTLPVWLPQLFESTIVELRQAKQRGTDERS